MVKLSGTADVHNGPVGCSYNFRGVTPYKQKINLFKTNIMSSLQTQPYSSDKSVNQPPSWKIKLLYDGECPLCVREVNFLTKRDAGRGLVAFVDIAADDYKSEANGGVDYETAMGRIHAVLPDGTLVKNIEVFRRVYETLGMGWVLCCDQVANCRRDC